MNQREHNGMAWFSIQAPREIQAEMILGYNANPIQDGLRKTVLFRNTDKCLFGNPAIMLVTWPTTTPLPKFAVDSNGIFQRRMVSSYLNYVLMSNFVIVKKTQLSIEKLFKKIMGFQIICKLFEPCPFTKYNARISEANGRNSS